MSNPIEDVSVIGARELKRKLDSGEQFKLVIALGEWEFRAKHIPGSVHFPTADDAFAVLQPADEIVVYCSTETCPSFRASWSSVRWW